MIDIAKLLGLNIKLVLASKSPRRRDLLTRLGFEFEIMPADIDEDAISTQLPPEEYVTRLSMAKARHIAAQLQGMMRHYLVLGADTIVVLDGEIINKPQSPDHAVEMLERLSGNTHTVYTGIALANVEWARSCSAVQSTKVTFRKLEREEIQAYVDTGSPLDKAGAYGIQDDFGSVFVSHIEGCYYNIVGLPLELMYTTMRDFLKNG